MEVADGTYTGSGNFELNFYGKSLLLKSANGPSNCVIDCELAGRGFVFENGEGSASVLRGFTVWNGYDSDGGGAVFCNGAAPLIEACVFASNRSYFGGAVNAQGGSDLLLRDCWFMNNEANWGGGAVYLDSSRMVVDGCRFEGNVTYGGAALLAGSSEVTVKNSVIVGNECLPRLTTGALMFLDSTTVLENCLINSNLAPGGVHCYGGTLTARNCTVADNSENGFYMENDAALTLRNSIVWGNGSEPVYPAGLTNITFCCLPSGSASQHNVFTAPVFTNGYRLSPVSPCIDRGTSEDAPAVDLEGVPRWDHPWRSNGVDSAAVDLGAYEFTDTDSDNNGLGDAWELYYFGNLLCDPLGDPDGDGLTTEEEYRYNTNPLNADTDGDGMPDGWEVANGFNPLVNDASADADSDGLTNLQEYQRGTNPRLADTDGDGMPDGWEVANGFNPLSNADAAEDADNDGLTNVQEYAAGTDPYNADTDGDGLSDYAEINTHGTNPLNADSDEDGLNDGAEVNIYGTDPLNPDTDSDGMPDGWEIASGFNPLSNADAAEDADNDGLTNVQEYAAGTDPHNADTDGDGLSDSDEVNIYGTNPANADTDGDTMPDGWEVANGFNPVVAENCDLDGDGLSNMQELSLGTDMNNPDTDSDGLPDGWEVLHGLSPLVNDAALDSDGDGLTNLQEYQNGTDPQNPDTDGDGLTDGAEVNTHGADPLNADSDEDGLNDGAEVSIYSTSPVNADSDGDGVQDGSEVACGMNPMNPDTDSDGIPDNRDVTGDGLMLVTVTNQLPEYYAQVLPGTGNPEYEATVTFTPVLPSNTVRIVNAVVDGWIDDSFKINGVQYGWTWGLKPFHENITSALPDPTNGVFDIELYDHVDPGWFGNGVSISGTCVMDCLVAIKVESILPNIGREVDDGDGNDKTKVFVVSVTNTSDVTVTAILNPATAEADLPSGWTINGGQGSGKLQRTVSTASASKTEFTFACGGADSGLKTTIYVYDVKLGLYADEGNAAQDKYGHSWWTFTVDAGIKEFIRDRYPDIDDNKYFGTAGWWPDTTDPDATFDPIKGWCLSARGIVQFGDQNHTATGSKTWDIGYDSLVASLNYVRNLETSGKNWTVLLDNCTDEAIIVGNEAGVSTISCFGITSPEDLSDWLNDN